MTANYISFFILLNGGGDAVGLAGASPCDYNGSVSTDKPRKALRFIEIHSFLTHKNFVTLQTFLTNGRHERYI